MYASELKGKKRSDNVEGRGNAWLKQQPLHIRQAILGVKGEQEWKAGRTGWMEKARNISPVFEKKESRLFELILQLHGNQQKTKANAAGHGIIKVKKATLIFKPNSITETVGKHGGINRNYYGETARQSKQISNHDHGNRKEHPFGEKRRTCT